MLRRVFGKKREGIGLQAYGQRDPKVEYKMAAYDMFNEMLESIQQDTVRLLFLMSVFSRKNRAALTVSCANHKYMRQYCAEICHRIVMGETYKIEFRKVRK